MNPASLTSWLLSQATHERLYLAHVAAMVLLVLTTSACGLAGFREDALGPAKSTLGTTGFPPVQDQAAGSGPQPWLGRRLVLDEPFTHGRVGPAQPWGWQTGAYPDCRTNPDNYKLDLLSKRALDFSDGKLRITASPARDGRWQTGLVTSGDSCSSGGLGFEVTTDDLVMARVRLPRSNAGAWPGIWTWREGGNEVDLFEWHSDRPHTLEFVNHFRGDGKYWTDPAVVDRGKWLNVAVHLGRRQVTWYVGSTRGRMRVVFADRFGVGPRFRAHLIINLSVDDGRLHASPQTSSPFAFHIDSVAVYRR
ncbi:hypothetical protein ACIBH1_25445 [Nonomuraea sp. NPDC050663]|uniref:hypothetical protein n=1 Tax=Nonomuraea sp. NPDC050663 TaxID=3364370 RepID=UPI0037AFAECD